MLGGQSGEQRTGVLAALRRVAATEACSRSSAHRPRVGWTTLGGYIFFAAGEQLRVPMLMRHCKQQQLMERQQQQQQQQQQQHEQQLLQSAAAA